MGSRERQERERLAMEEEIIATALAMVRAEGAANLSLRRVAERMEYSSAALYRYFEDKAALVAALCTRGFAELAARVRAVPADLPPAERLQAQGDAYLRFAAEEPHLYTLMFVDVLPRSPAMAPSPPPEALIDDAAFGQLYRGLADGAASGAFRLAPDQVLPAAIGAWALVHGYAMLRTRFPDAVTPALTAVGLRALAAGLAS
jgi:AcrR family transcriptional regulator